MRAKRAWIGPATAAAVLLSVVRPAAAVAPGAFSLAHARASLSAPRAVALTDVTADGLADLVSINASGSDLRVFVGTGTSLGSSQAHETPSSGATALTNGDFDGDGRGDVAVAFTMPPGVRLWYGNTPVPITGPLVPLAAEPGSLAAADVDKDGKVDLLVGFPSSASITLLRNIGGGSFTSTPVPMGSGGVADLIVGDFNGDTVPDIAAALSTGTVAVALGNGAGGFLAATHAAVFASPGRLALGDVNGDGRLDVAVTSAAAGQVLVLYGNGAGGFSSGTVAALPGATGVAVGSLAGPGAQIVVATSVTEDVVVTFRRSGGALEPGTPHATGGGAPVDVDVGDVDGDGSLDIAVANQATHLVTVLRSRGLAHTPEPFTFARRLVGTGAQTNFWLVNLGYAGLNTETVSFTGSHPLDFSVVDRCHGTTLAFSASCDFLITFRPTAVGRRSATLTIPNDGASGVATIEVSGEGFDDRPPASTIDQTNGSLLLSATHDLTGTASDVGIGVDSVTITYAHPLVDTVTPAALSCAGQRPTQCTWYAELPTLPGPYTVTAVAVDRAGNADPDPPSITVVIV